MNEFGESTTGLTSRGRIKTSSRLYKMWLSLFRGYAVVTRTQTPMGYTLGRLTYKTSWVLRPKEEE